MLDENVTFLYIVEYFNKVCNAANISPPKEKTSSPPKGNE